MKNFKYRFEALLLVLMIVSVWLPDAFFKPIFVVVLSYIVIHYLMSQIKRFRGKHHVG